MKKLNYVHRISRELQIAIKQTEPEALDDNNHLKAGYHLNYVFDDSSPINFYIITTDDNNGKIKTCTAFALMEDFTDLISEGVVTQKELESADYELSKFDTASGHTELVSVSFI